MDCTWTVHTQACSNVTQLCSRPSDAAIGAACEMMGFVPDRMPLPAIADALME